MYMDIDKVVRQGDIIRGLEYEFIENQEKVPFPYVVVLTQDCDLDQDYKARLVDNHDKYIDSVLVAPAFIATELQNGSHLVILGRHTEKKGKTTGTVWNYIKTNRDPRYHLLSSDTDYSIPELVIDFKHFYTVPRELIYSAHQDKCIATIDELFREHLSTRFASFLARIALPDTDE
jgi:hypothetical protein